MALKVTIGGGGTLFMGTDKVLRFNLKDSAGEAVDATSYDINFVVRKTVNATDTILDKPATVSGAFSSTNNPQRILVELLDTELIMKPSTYKHSLKRMDSGAEDILAYGDFIIEKATQI